MAQEMGFELRFDEAADRALSIDTAGSEEDVIRRLTRDANVMVFTTADNRCADALLVSKVWFIGAGEAVTVAAAIPRPIPVTTPASVQTSQVDSQPNKNGPGDQNEQKRRRDMSPEERYYDRIQRQNRKTIRRVINPRPTGITVRFLTIFTVIASLLLACSEVPESAPETRLAATSDSNPDEPQASTGDRRGRAERGPRRPCTGEVAMLIDDELIWDTKKDTELHNLDGLVTLGEGANRGKQALPFAFLLDSTDGAESIEISACNGRVRQFSRGELDAKRDSLYLVVTRYRGLKLHNAEGESSRRSRMKNIDRISIRTQQP